MFVDLKDFQGLERNSCWAYQGYVSFRANVPFF